MQMLKLKLSFWATISTALFYSIWGLIFGGVPSLDSVWLDEVAKLNLPFSISRWWDVFFMPIWVYLIFFVSMKARESREDEDKNHLATGLMHGLLVGSLAGGLWGLAIFGMPLSLIFGQGGLFGSLLICFVLNVLCGFAFVGLLSICCPALGLSAAVGVGLFTGLVASPIVGLGPGLLVVLATSSMCALSVIPGFLYYYLEPMGRVYHTKNNREAFALFFKS